MQYRTLTGTGIKVSRVSLGTMTFGNQASESEAIKMVDYALDKGVNFIDTADIYSKGAAEIILGKALKGKRDTVVLASKVRHFMGPDEFKDVGLHRWHIVKGIEASLRRLNTDCLDICYLHGADYETPFEETLTAMDQLVRQGKVMYMGISNCAAWQVCQALWLCDRKNLYPPVVTQVPYNLITRAIESELVPFCRTFDVGMTVYNPLAAGLLTGKYSRDKVPAKGTRFEVNKHYYNRYWDDSNFEALAELERIARKSGKKMIALALQWLLDQAHVDSVVLGVSKIEQLQENLTAWEGKLDGSIREACNRVWKKIRGAHFQYNR